MGGIVLQRTMTKCQSSEAGFTLVEVIIAAGVIGMAMAMTMGSLMSVATAQRTSETDAMAAAYASSVLEEVREGSMNALLGYVPPKLRGLGSSAVVTVSCIDTGGQSVALPLANGAAEPELPNPTQVDVTITWADSSGRVRALTTTSYHRR